MTWINGLRNTFLICTEKSVSLLQLVGIWVLAHRSSSTGGACRHMYLAMTDFYHMNTFSTSHHLTDLVLHVRDQVMEGDKEMSPAAV